jgi:MFS family permease
MTGSVIGPLVFSWLADWLGVLNIVIFSVTISGALQFALLGATTSGSVIIVGLLYGFFSSGFQALLGPIFSRLSFSVTEIGHRMGLGFFVIGVGSLIGSSCILLLRRILNVIFSTGSPIQGALLGSAFDWWKAVLFSAVSFPLVPIHSPISLMQTRSFLVYAALSSFLSGDNFCDQYSTRTRSDGRYLRLLRTS